MANNTKRTINKTEHTNNSKPKNVAQLVKKPQRETFGARQLLAVPLLALTAYCLYVIITNLSSFSQILSAPYAVLIFPPFPAIFIGAFSCLAIYMLIKWRPMGRLAVAVAWLLTLVFVWFVLTWLWSTFPGTNPSKCEGLFGVQQNCADVAYFQAYVLLLNPFCLGLYSLLSLAGISTMVMRLRQHD